MNAEHRPTLKVLRVDASGRRAGSVSRRLTDELIEALRAEHGAVDVVTRDLAAEPVPFVDEVWIDAKQATPEAQTPRHRDAMAFSDELVAELKGADVIVVGAPVYNFAIPASLKAWIDLVARPRVTFRYTPRGPVGLLEGKRAYVVMASGGTPIGSEVDFASGYLRHLLGFLGIEDVEIIAADLLIANADDALERARRQIATSVLEALAEPARVREV
jgi:FMN-dependent NADH-azoreductase